MDRGSKVCSQDLGHMNRMATTPINVKTLYFFSSSEPMGQWPSDWHAALGTWTRHHVITWVNLELFYGKIKFCPYAFVRDEVVIEFFRNNHRLCYKMHQHATLTKGLLTSKFCPLGSSIRRPSVNMFKHIFRSHRTD